MGSLLAVFAGLLRAELWEEVLCESGMVHRHASCPLHVCLSPALCTPRSTWSERGSASAWLQEAGGQHLPAFVPSLVAPSSPGWAVGFVSMWGRKPQNSRHSAPLPCSVWGLSGWAETAAVWAFYRCPGQNRNSCRAQPGTTCARVPCMSGDHQALWGSKRGSQSCALPPPGCRGAGSGKPRGSSGLPPPPQGWSPSPSTWQGRPGQGCSPGTWLCPTWLSLPHPARLGYLPPF